MFASVPKNTLLDILESVKWVFVVAYIISTIGVTVGVYWEGEQFDKVKQRRGWRLLICSLAADTFFTIMVFGIEGWIGHTQRDEIIALEKKLAPRLLTTQQVLSLAAQLRPYSGQEFVITPYWDMKESLDLANRIFDVLSSADWKYIKPEKQGFMLGGIEGVQVWVHPSADASTRKAAQELVSALNGVDLHAVLREQNSANPKDNKIGLNVGAKPQ
jgi:hypothetical protein